MKSRTLRTVTGALALAVIAPLPAAYAAPGNASVEEPAVQAPEAPAPEEPVVEVPEAPAPEAPAPEAPAPEAPAPTTQQRDHAPVAPQKALQLDSPAPAQGLPHHTAAAAGIGTEAEHAAEFTDSPAVGQQATDAGSAASPSADGPRHRVIDAGAAGPMSSEAPWAQAAGAIGLVASMGLVALGLKNRRQGRHAE